MNAQSRKVTVNLTARGDAAVTKIQDHFPGASLTQVISTSPQVVSALLDGIHEDGGIRVLMPDGSQKTILLFL